MPADSQSNLDSILSIRSRLNEITIQLLLTTDNCWDLDKTLVELSNDLILILKKADNLREKLKFSQDKILLPIDPEFDNLWDYLLKNSILPREDREYLTKKYVLAHMLSKKKNKFKFFSPTPGKAYDITFLPCNSAAEFWHTCTKEKIP